ncbi:hypothetical protein [Streptomyces sp. CA-111067]|uniref:hypothetical protein n=1 Tax=Streptomyces sp. CA-111067 TaxID=3240046 RepID=UPI003D9612E1
MVKIKSPATGVALAIILVAPAACGKNGGQAQRPPVNLLIDAPRGAGVWRHTSWWEQDKGNSASRRWLRGVSDFTEIADAFGSVDAAKDHFRNLAPEKISPDVYRGVKNDDIGATMDGADEVEFKCGETNGSACMTWWTWARYGKYTVQFTYRHDPADATALTDTELAMIVSNAGREVAKKARGNS